MSVARTLAHSVAQPYWLSKCSARITVRRRVVTTEKRVLTRLAMWKAAWAMPILRVKIRS